MTAIFFDGVNLDSLMSYDCCWPVDESRTYEDATSERTTVRLVRFVADYLGSTPDAIVICEDWLAERKDIPNLGVVPPRIACYEDEVYYLLTPDITDPDALEVAIGPAARYQTGICSTCSRVPEGDIPVERYFDEIVGNLRHVFVPAFDGSGYLIWSVV